MEELDHEFKKGFSKEILRTSQAEFLSLWPQGNGKIDMDESSIPRSPLYKSPSLSAS